MRRSRSSLEYRGRVACARSGWRWRGERLGAAWWHPSQWTEVHLRGIGVTDISWNHSEDCFAWKTKIIHLINPVCHR